MCLLSRTWHARALIHARWPYVLTLVVCFGGAACFFLWLNRKTSYLVAATSLCSLAGAWAIRAALRGSFDEGTIALLAIGFGLPGVFICGNQRRRSPAMLTIAGGFFCWGAVSPMGLLIDRIAPSLIIPGELWNTPKFFVAFGMILAVVEDKSKSISGMQHKAQVLNRQLERFSAITSRLLSGARLDTMCPAIAAAITEVSNFRVPWSNSKMQNAGCEWLALVGCRQSLCGTWRFMRKTGRSITLRTCVPMRSSWGRICTY